MRLIQACRIHVMLWCTTVAIVVAVSATVVAAAEPRIPGPQPDGSVVLPNQWSLRPVGRQVTVGDFPAAIAMHPAGTYAVVLHCGYGPHELIVLDVGSRSIVSRTAVPEAFYGVAFDTSGERLFCSGSSDESIRAYRFEAGALIPAAEYPLRDKKERGIPAGIAVSGDGRILYAANLWGQSVSMVADAGDGESRVRELSLAQKKQAQPPGAESSTAVSDESDAAREDGASERSLTKRAEQLLENTDPTLPFPYACVLDEPRGRLYVSLWSQAAVAVIDLASFAEVARWQVEEHPNEMLLAPDGSRLFVANANRNSVSVLDPASGTISETLVANLTPDALPGNTPNSLALSADGRLFVANAAINTVAVFDVAEPGRSRSLGFIPVGWYPTSVRLSADGQRLLVANGKGIISDSNRNGPKPGFAGAPTPDYIGGLFDGTVSFIDLPDGEDAFTKQMAAWSATAYACMPQPPSDEDLANLEGHPVPRSKGDTSPLTHVIYIVKENRTYDQVFGDMPEGRGDPTLCLFPEKVTPNHHALAREFVLLDNFYVESEVSADGHEWSMGAFATDFVEKQWPLGYGHSKKIPYPSEGAFVAATPAGGYIWDRAIAAGVSVRSYGEWVANGKDPSQPGTAKTPSLEGRFDPFFRGFDMEYSDLDRADRFIEELHRFDTEGEMPRLQIVRLPNDHTSGSKPGALTPTSFMAENDLALGRIVEAVSKSTFWPNTAIFVVQDDAQNGSDHIDAHRTVAMVASPYARRGVVDSTLYSTSSMLHTIELILGLDPMSPFDAAAMPMFDCFTRDADGRPFTCRPAQVPLDNLNADTAWGAAASLAMDFSREDAADDLLLNEIVWKSVRGHDSPMPPPRRAAFVLVSDEDDEDAEEENDDQEDDEDRSLETRCSDNDPLPAGDEAANNPTPAPLPERPSFDRDVMPILTARGCNMGACHGKSGGQNGFALSLFGFDPASDYFAITANARGRRVMFAAPDESLLLTKGTAAVPHGGGVRLEPDGADAEVLRR
ncbi:MAG: bifunctional YncE family protein/alkaline phosphatase family protein, partial [Pirellulales bacterium]